MTWDFLSQNPESVHQLMITFSDRGTPLGYHHMHAYSGHTFKFINAEGKFHYVQIHFRKEGGFRTIDSATATKFAGENPDYGIQSLYEDIANGNFPVWTMYVVRIYFSPLS